MNPLYVVAGLVVVILVWAVSVYNRLAILGQRTDEAWSDIDVQLKRRYDLVPNLVETVKGYAKHEKTVFEEVTKARTAAMQATDRSEQGKAENMLTSALKSVFAVAEAYPELRASDNFRQLQAELSDIEDKIVAARRFYNGNVRDLNTTIQVFPNSLFASLFGGKRRDFFELSDTAEREVVKVNFEDKPEEEKTTP